MAAWCSTKYSRPGARGCTHLHAAQWHAPRQAPWQAAGMRHRPQQWPAVATGQQAGPTLHGAPAAHPVHSAARTLALRRATPAASVRAPEGAAPRLPCVQQVHLCARAGTRGRMWACAGASSQAGGYLRRRAHLRALLGVGVDGVEGPVLGAAHCEVEGGVGLPEQQGACCGSLGVKGAQSQGRSAAHARQGPCCVPQQQAGSWRGVAWWWPLVAWRGAAWRMCCALEAHKPAQWPVRLTIRCGASRTAVGLAERVHADL